MPRSVPGLALVASFVLAAGPVFATQLAVAAAPGTGADATTAPNAAPPGPAWLPRHVAELQVMEKIEGQSGTLSVKVGQTVQYKTLTITRRACLARPPDQAKDSTAFLDITDSRQGAPGFHGWLFHNEPSISIFQSPVYAIQLNDCRD